MLILGDKNIKNLKIGDNGIFKAMYNGKTVYRNHPVFLDYVEFDGNSWNDTGIALNHTSDVGYWKTKISWQEPFQFMGANGNAVLLGSNNTLTTAGSSGQPYSLNTVYDITVGLDSAHKRYLTVGGTTYVGSVASLTHNIFICNLGGPSGYGSKAKLYSFEVCSNGTLVRNLRPCLDPCNVVCFYDLVSGKYFYNQGTGTLKAGGRFVESIIFDGNSWIDTGKYANQNTEINTTFKHNTFERAIYGVRDGNNNCTGYASVNGAWRFGSNMANYRTEANTIYNVVQNRQGIDINGLYTAYTDTTSEFTSSYTILLGKQNNTTFSPFKGEINVFRIKESGVDIQDLRPLVDEDGVACFVDLVTGKRFYNQGTGKLKYKDFERLPYLAFDGASYIDTGVKGRSGISVNYDVYIPKTNIDTGLVFPTGSRNEGDARFYLGVVIYGYGKCWGLSIGYDSYGQNQKPTGDKYYSIIANTSSTGGELIVDGKSIVTTTATVTTDYNIYVGGANNYGTPQLSGTNGLRFKHYTMFEDNKLKHQYIPVRRSDNVICFYDFAEGKYYEKAVA